MKTIFELTYQNEVVYKGNENGAYLELQKRQGSSANRAKQNGWAVNEIQVSDDEFSSINSLDKWVDVDCILLEDMKGGMNHIVKVKIVETGQEGKANTYAMRYASMSAGSPVSVMRNYLSIE